jgi:hypothetical protein
LLSLASHLLVVLVIEVDDPAAGRVFELLNLGQLGFTGVLRCVSLHDLSSGVILTEAMSPTAARAARETKDFILIYYTINNNLTLI